MSETPLEAVPHGGDSAAKTADTDWVWSDAMLISTAGVAVPFTMIDNATADGDTSPVINIVPDAAYPVGNPVTTTIAVVYDDRRIHTTPSRALTAASTPAIVLGTPSPNISRYAFRTPWSPLASPKSRFLFYSPFRGIPLH